MYIIISFTNNNIGDKMKKKEQKINCEVFDCNYCNCDDCKCELEEIKVCNCADNENKEATMCDSYKKRKN